MHIDYKRIVLCCFLVYNCFICTHLFKLESNIINLVNSIPNNSWKAGLNKNFNQNFLKNVSRLMGVLPRITLNTNDDLPMNDLFKRKSLPKNYDVTLEWSECKSIVTIRDQSNCGSCWALSTASAFGDRLCIATNKNINKVLSGEYINSCCAGKCGSGCNGGHPEKAWKYIKNKGLCTGGEYNTNEGCQPYSIAPCPRHYIYCKETNKNTPECYKNQCTNYDYDTPLLSDLYYATKVYSVKPKVDAIMNEIYINGPVVAAMKVYEDFIHYKDGIYQYTMGASHGDHAVKLMGWGHEDGIDYWLCANTWGTSWGKNGMFKILRGNNECGIEDRISGGLPEI